MRARSPRIDFTIAAVVLLTVAPGHANAPAGRYTIPVTGAVYDPKTKLTWQQPFAPDMYTWGSATALGTAQNYCATLATPIGTGWRLPTVGELGTLVDYSQAAGAAALIDPTFFPETPLEPFWSSTPNAADTSSPWSVDFGGGQTLAWSGSILVRCVR
jgi:hypothetical protein